MAKPNYRKLERDPGTRAKVPTSKLSERYLDSRYRRLAKDKSTRAAIPTKRLSPRHRAIREATERSRVRNDPNTLLAPRSPKMVDEQLAADTKLKFGEEEGRLNRQIAESPQRQEQITGYFDDYLTKLRELRAESAAASTTAQQSHQARTEATSKLDETQRQDIDAQMAREAAIRGAVAPPSVESQQAATVRRGNADSFGGLLSSQAQAQGDYQREQERIGLRQQVDEGVKESQRVEMLKDLFRELSGQKGAFQVSRGAELQGAERDYGLQRQTLKESSRSNRVKESLEAIAFGVKQTDAQRKANRDRGKRDTDLKDDRARERRLAAADQRAADRDAYQRKHKLGPYKPGGKKGEKGMSQSGRKLRAQTEAAINDVLAGRPLVSKKKDILGETTKTPRYKGLAFQAAVYYRKHGKLSPDLIRQLQQAGVTSIPSRWKGK